MLGRVRLDASGPRPVHCRRASPEIGAKGWRLVGVLAFDRRRHASSPHEAAGDESMAFTIDNVPVTFDMTTFDSLCKQEGVTWMLSSMNDLRKKLGKTPPASATEVLQEIRKIAVDKRQKYKKSIKYVAFSWPNLVTGVNLVAEGRMLDRLDFQQMFATMNPTTDFVDLQYGISAARGFAPYKLSAGRMRFADDFNNASNLGTGAAFQRNWQGYGFLGATSDSVKQVFKTGEKADPSGKVRGIAGATRMEYVHSLLGSRYSPTRSLNEPAKKMEKDTQKSLSDMAGIHGKKEAEAHYWLHARFVKSVRRACKGGIAMVASHPAYRAVDAKVHFVLDGLGDLGKMARKDKLPPDKGGYLAITSSELAFCCRYWNDPEFPLSGVVKFYVNGKRVMPPWEADWTVVDATGANVYSNQEAWLRYMLARDLLGVTGKKFPRMTGDEDEA
jgi:hypothetical protein